MSEQCCTKYSLRLKVFILQGSSLNREVNNSKQLQHVPETDQIHYATPCKSKQNRGGGCWETLSEEQSSAAKTTLRPASYLEDKETQKI